MSDTWIWMPDSMFEEACRTPGAWYRELRAFTYTVANPSCHMLEEIIREMYVKYVPASDTYWVYHKDRVSGDCQVLLSGELLSSLEDSCKCSFKGNGYICVPWTDIMRDDAIVSNKTFERYFGAGAFKKMEPGATPVTVDPEWGLLVHREPHQDEDGKINGRFL